MSGILDKAKHMVFEETEEKKPANLPVHGTVAPHAMYQTVVQQPPYSPAPGIATGDGSVYQKLKEKTDFSRTVVGSTLQKYLDPLATVSLDERSKFKAALAQARALEHITDESILAAFDQLTAMLQDEHEAFGRAAQAFDTQEVQKRNGELQATNDAIVAKTKELEALHTKASALQSELAVAQEKSRNRGAEFEGAMATRASEIAREKQHYEELLKN